MKISKKIKFFIALISLFYSISLIQTTYAKYVSSADAKANLTIARWNVLINNQDIKNSSDFTSTISPVFSGSTNIAPNIIAPTATGYFDVTINGESTDVSYSYTLTLTQATTNTVSDLAITKYTIDGGTTQYSLTNNAFTATTNRTDETKTHTYRFYVEWLDGDGTTMDNSADTTATTSGVAAYAVNINLIQLAN